MLRTWLCGMVVAGAVLTLSSLARTGEPGLGFGLHGTEGIQELSAYQRFFYSPGGRDPLVMRLPTEGERGLARRQDIPAAPTLEQMEITLSSWLEELQHAVKSRDYAHAIDVAREAAEVMETSWPRIRNDDRGLSVKRAEIRKLGAVALRLHNQELVGREFAALGLQVNGISWSPSDARAMVNGTSHTVGEVLLSVRVQGDLRLERIEEGGVVFDFQGMRFRVPIQVYN